MRIAKRTISLKLSNSILCMMWLRWLSTVRVETPSTAAASFGPAFTVGAGFESLPYVVIYSPAGKRTIIDAMDAKKLDKALTR